MAVEAVAAEHGVARAKRPPGRLSWFEGFVLSLTMPAALIATLGYSISSLGVWLAIGLWGVSMVLATLANRAYAELAGMFPEKPGIALYAWEGWRSRISLVGRIRQMVNIR